MWERARIGSEGSTDIGEHAAQPRFTGHRKFMRRPLQQWLTPACSRLPLTISGQPCTLTLPFIMVFLSWLVPAARMSWDRRVQAQGQMRSRGCRGFPQARRRTTNSAQAPATFPNPTVAGKSAHLSLDTEKTSSFFTCAFLSLVFSSGISEQKGPVSCPHPALLPGFHLQKPLWWPLRPHLDSSIWVWDGASEKCFSRVAPQPLAEVVSSRLSVCHGSFLSFTACLAGGARCHGVIGSAYELQWVSDVSYSQGREKNQRNKSKILLQWRPI